MSGKAIIILASVLLMAGACSASSALSYIEFNSSNFDQLDTKIAEIQALGVQVVHIFPPNAILGKIVPESAERIRAASGARLIYTPSHYLASDDGRKDQPANNNAYMVWRYLLDENREGKEQNLPPGPPLANCIIRSTDSSDLDYQSAGDRGGRWFDIKDMYTSSYLIGRVAVKMILMESNGSIETDNPDRLIRPFVKWQRDWTFWQKQQRHMMSI